MDNPNGSRNSSLELLAILFYETLTPPSFCNICWLCCLRCCNGHCVRAAATLAGDFAFAVSDCGSLALHRQPGHHWNSRV